MFERFTEKSRLAAVRAQNYAHRFGHERIEVEDLLCALRECSEAGEVLAHLWPGAADLEQAAASASGAPRPQFTSGQLPFSDRAKEALRAAQSEALQMGHTYIGCEHLLLGVCKVGGHSLIPPYAEIKARLVERLAKRPLRWPEALEAATADYLDATEKVVEILEGSHTISVLDLARAVTIASDATTSLENAINDIKVEKRPK